jgi:PAS domain S-box-containing protein
MRPTAPRKKPSKRAEEPSGEGGRRLLAEAAEANAKFRAFFEQGALFAGIMDVDGTILEPNRLSWEGCGYTREQIVGKPFWECPWWTPSAALMERIKAASAQAATGQTFRAEMPYFVADGSERMVDIIILPIKDETGRVVFIAPTGTDITDRKRAEEDRRNLVSLVENSTDFIGMCDLEGIPFYVNQAGLAMVGLDGIEEARRTHVREFFFPEDQPKIMDELFPSALEQGHGEVEVRFRHFKTGEARWMTYKVFTLADPTGRKIGLATISRDVTERRRLEQDLRNLAADLSEAGRHKDEFLATLAHELRNPLAPIRNGLELMRLAAHDGRVVEQARAMMERQLAHMVRLVDDLLDVSRITQNKLDLRKERVELSAVVSSAVETSRPLIESRGHALTVSLPPAPIYLDADLTRLAQVFSNLLNNAARYTETGGRIRLAAEPQGDEVVVAVKDTGMGIPSVLLPHVFEMFRQGDRILERSQGGLGIGLTLVKRLVELHGGSVEARSEGRGLGSELVVRLPIFRDDRKAAEPAAGEPARAAARRILVVDDYRDSATSLATLLELAGNETHTAYDGLEAVEAAAAFQPDVVLLDIGLPEMNGYEAARKIREQPWGKTMALVALTGWGQEEDRQKSREAGFLAHLVKPVDYAALLKLLAELPAPDRAG